MDIYADFNSPDRSTRQKALLEIYSNFSFTAETKLDYYIQALKDPYDILRSTGAEFLIKSFGTEERIQKILMHHIEIEPFWVVRYSILQQIKQFDLSPYKQILLNLSFDLKPQVRTVVASIISTFDDDNIWDRLLEMWGDKDDRVRNKVEEILDKSNKPDIANLIDNYKKKLLEKEQKKQEIASMFNDT